MSDFESCSWESDSTVHFLNSPIGAVNFASDCDWSSDESTSGNDRVHNDHPSGLHTPNFGQTYQHPKTVLGSQTAV